MEKESYASIGRDIRKDWIYWVVVPLGTAVLLGGLYFGRSKCSTDDNPKRPPIKNIESTFKDNK